jgi:hypothetical protein
MACRSHVRSGTEFKLLDGKEMLQTSTGRFHFSFLSHVPSFSTLGPAVDGSRQLPPLCSTLSYLPVRSLPTPDSGPSYHVLAKASYSADARSIFLSQMAEAHVRTISPVRWCAVASCLMGNRIASHGSTVVQTASSNCTGL